MLIFSGTGERAAHKFQIGAVGIGKEIEKFEGEFEEFGESVAQTAIKLFGK